MLLRYFDWRIKMARPLSAWMLTIGGLVRPAFVDGDFLGHVVQADSPFEECAGRGTIALGTQQKINGSDILLYCPVQVLPFARDPDVGLISI